MKRQRESTRLDEYNVADRANIDARRRQQFEHLGNGPVAERHSGTQRSEQPDRSPVGVDIDVQRRRLLAEPRHLLDVAA